MSIAVPVACHEGHDAYWFIIEDDGTLTVEGEDWDSMQAAVALGFEPAICASIYNYFKERPFMLLMGSTVVPFGVGDLLYVATKIAEEQSFDQLYPEATEDYAVYKKLARGVLVPMPDRDESGHWGETTMEQLELMSEQDRHVVRSLWALRQLAYDRREHLVDRKWRRRLDTTDSQFQNFLKYVAKSRIKRLEPDPLREEEDRLFTQAIGLIQDILEERDLDEDE